MTAEVLAALCTTCGASLTSVLCITQGHNDGGLVSSLSISSHHAVPLNVRSFVHSFVVAHGKKTWHFVALNGLSWQKLPCDFHALSGYLHEGSMTCSWAFLRLRGTACAPSWASIWHFHGTFVKYTSMWFRERSRYKLPINDSLMEIFREDCRADSHGNCDGAAMAAVKKTQGAMGFH